MFSNKTLSVIRSIEEFGKHRKGVCRVYFPDETFRDIPVEEIQEMKYKDFHEIAVKLDAISAKSNKIP